MTAIALVRARLAAAITLALLTGSCAVLPQAGPVDPATTLLVQHQHLLHAPGDSVTAAIANVRARVAAAPSLRNRVELALLLTLPGGPLQQRQEARELLGTCESTASEDPVAALCSVTAGLLTEQLAAQQKLQALEEEAPAAELRSLDLQRQLGALYAQSAARLELEAQKRMRTLERQLSEQRAQLDAMRLQLQELQAIERSIETRRESPAEASRTP